MIAGKIFYAVGGWLIEKTPIYGRQI